jgi:hypothetical protein
MGASLKSKAFADLVISMTSTERIAMAIDLLGAIKDDQSIRPEPVSADEAKRVAEALLNLAREIEEHHPGGQGW